MSIRATEHEQKIRQADGTAMPASTRSVMRVSGMEDSADWLHATVRLLLLFIVGAAGQTRD